jgi:hypothetical protein
VPDLYWQGSEREGLVFGLREKSLIGRLKLPRVLVKLAAAAKSSWLICGGVQPLIERSEIMSDMRNRYLKGGLAAALCAATGAWAATSASLPPEQTSGPVRYVSGGVGKDQQAAMKQAASKYVLELEFVQGGKGADVFMANVPVTIKDHTGKVILDARSDGPLMLAKLPDGQYTISAQNAGKTESRKVKIEHGKHEMVVFHWKT